MNEGLLWGFGLQHSEEQETRGEVTGYYSNGARWWDYIHSILQVFTMIKKERFPLLVSYTQLCSHYLKHHSLNKGLQYVVKSRCDILK